jgi:hypothetical protein
MLAAGSNVGYKAFTLIPNDPLIDEGSAKAKIATAEKCVYSAGFFARSEGFPGTSLPKHLPQKSTSLLKAGCTLSSFLLYLCPTSLLRYRDFLASRCRQPTHTLFCTALRALLERINQMLDFRQLRF